MPYFRVKGKSAETKGPRNRQYLAKTEAEAISKAEADGILVSSIAEIQPQPPTKKQLEYASDLGISIPDNVTKDEISDLISTRVSNDKPSTSRHRSFAESFGLEPTQYVGKKMLFDSIWNTLKNEDRQLEMLQWFAFRVYRSLVAGAENAPIDSAFDATIIAIAQSLAKDDKAIASIKRYDGRSLIWFGQWTAPDGANITGASNRTIGYKETSRMLSARLGIGEATEMTNAMPRQVTNSGIKPSRVRTNPPREKSDATHRKGTKRVALAVILSIVGLFFSGLSLIAIPLLVSGSEALLGETAPGAVQRKAPQVSPILLVIGLASGVMGIFLPVFTFISFILIVQYYTKRCPQIYKGAKLPAG